MWDTVVQDAVAWVFDTVEERYGLFAAWPVTLTLAAAIFGGIAAILTAMP